MLQGGIYTLLTFDYLELLDSNQSVPSETSSHVMLEPAMMAAYLLTCWACVDLLVPVGTCSGRGLQKHDMEGLEC